MRWPAALALVILAGCLGPASSPDAAAQDCSVNSAAVDATTAAVLLPAAAPEDARASFGPLPRITVTAREGQMLDAAAQFTPLGGEVDVLFDGPQHTAVRTRNTWTVATPVNAGDYTLELVGAPLAYGVTYTLILIASGCTPVP